MTRIFEERWPEVRSNEQLQALIAENDLLDPAYINTATSFMLKRQKDLIERMWSNFEPYADPGFRKKITLKGEFLSRCWEMTVACSLLRIGYSLRPKKSDAGPDIKIVSATPAIWVEAVSATHGQGPDAVPNLVYGIAQHFPREEMLLRFGNSVTSKFSRYRKYLENGLVKPNEPFVIAVGKGSIDRPDDYPPVALRYLYGIGDVALRMQIDPRTAKTLATESFFTRQLPIPKKSGQEVPVAFFQDSNHAGISAVLYCDNHILNHPEPLGSDFVLHRNPNARVSIPDDFFPLGAEWIPEHGHIRYTEKKFTKQADAFEFLNNENTVD